MGAARPPSGSFPRSVELFALADVDPVVLDLEGPDGIAALEDALDEIGHRRGSGAVDEGHDRWIDCVDPAAHVASDGRLLIQANHPVALALDGSERHGVKVPPDSDRRRIAARDVEVEELANVGSGYQVAVHHDDRIGGWRGQQPERPGGAERHILAEVLDPAAEPAAIAEVLLDDLA